MTLFPKAAPCRPSIRDVAVAAEAAAGPAVAADVVVTHVPAGLFPKRKSIRWLVSRPSITPLTSTILYPCPEGQALATDAPQQDSREWTC